MYTTNKVHHPSGSIGTVQFIGNALKAMHTYDVHNCEVHCGEDE